MNNAGRIGYYLYVVAILRKKILTIHFLVSILASMEIHTHDGKKIRNIVAFYSLFLLKNEYFKKKYSKQFRTRK